MYAVIKTGGKQYKVAPDQLVTVERLAGDVGDSIELSEVLLVSGDKGIETGTPLVSGTKVTAEIVEQKRGDKIIVFKKKRRHNYRRTRGHRQELTVLRITAIGDVKAVAKKTPAKKAAPKKDEAKKVDVKADGAAKQPDAKQPDVKKADEKKEAPEKTAAKKAPAKKATPKKTAAKDDLKKIDGIGPVIEKKLNSLDITTFEQVATLTKAEMAEIDEKLDFKGRMEREDWVGQAKKLVKDKKD